MHKKSTVRNTPITMSSKPWFSSAGWTRSIFMATNNSTISQIRSLLQYSFHNSQFFSQLKEKRLLSCWMFHKNEKILNYIKGPYFCPQYWLLLPSVLCWISFSLQMLSHVYHILLELSFQNSVMNNANYWLVWRYLYLRHCSHFCSLVQNLFYKTKNKKLKL